MDPNLNKMMEQNYEDQFFGPMMERLTQAMMLLESDPLRAASLLNDLSVLAQRGAKNVTLIVRAAAEAEGGPTAYVGNVAGSAEQMIDRVKAQVVGPDGVIKQEVDTLALRQRG